MVFEKLQPKFATALRVLGFFVFLFILQIVISYILIKSTHIYQVESEIQELSNRINQDLRFKDGVWDTTLYNSDPITSVPNQSAAFPIYIITSDGFVIDRSQPINGYLDVSDYKHLSEFKSPQTISTAANESWRILSKKIHRNGQDFGIITTAYYNPQTNELNKIDEILVRDISIIDDAIEIKDDQIEVSKLDIRNTHLEVAFEVVTKFNKVLINNGRTPTYIDTSYVQEELKNIGFKTIQEPITGDEYRILSQVVKNDKNETVGIIVVGRSIESINELLGTYILYSLIIGIVLTLPLSILTVFILRREIYSIFKRTAEQKINRSPEKIEFNKKEAFILVGDERIDIPYDSNQYYLCVALFSHPKKKWEHDELLEEFGESFDSKHQRKIYDAALAVNRKTGLKLVMYQDKTFRLNPEFLEKIL